MNIYRELKDGGYSQDDAFSYLDPRTHEERILQEVADGEAELIPYADPTATEEDYIMFVQLRILDKTAQDYGYDNIFTAVTYADEPAVPQFQIEGAAFREWRSLVWAACHVILGEVEAGSREAPTFEELEAELPAFVNPND